MPDLLAPIAKRQVGRLPADHRFSRTEEENPAPISDAKTLCLQSRRLATRQRGRRRDWLISGKSSSGRLFKAAEIEGLRQDARKAWGDEAFDVSRVTEAVIWVLTKYPAGRGRAESVRRPFETFILRARRLDLAGHGETALDLIYDSVDELMRKGEFAQLNSLLANLSVSDFSVDILLGLLTATLPAKSRLPSRHELYEQIETFLRHCGEYKEGLLTGLE
jgi:hypothetical protein